MRRRVRRPGEAEDDVSFVCRCVCVCVCVRGWQLPCAAQAVEVVTAHDRRARRERDRLDSREV